MSSQNKIRLGIFGFGCVGQGLYHVLTQTKGIRAEILKICIKHPEKDRIIDRHYFTIDKEEILNNPQVDVVVELINDADAAYDIIKTALLSGKSVVTANKKMVAEHFSELYNIQKEKGVSLLYEGAVCASIPIIRNLEEYYDNDLLNAVEGIFNGSTNYILTKIFDENIDFSGALKKAQELGFAESDPWLDVSGTDSKYKLSIVLTHAFGIFVPPENIYNYGISNLSEFDIEIAKQRGWKIKLKAICRKVGSEVYAIVAPQFISADNNLYTVNEEYNGVAVEGAFSEHQFFVGKGAGGYPTGSAVLSDISALTYNYKYEYKKVGQNLGLSYSRNFYLDIYLRHGISEPNRYNFLNIDEMYKNNDHGYIFGKISFDSLVKNDFSNRDDVMVILCENSKPEQALTTSIKNGKVHQKSGIPLLKLYGLEFGMM